MTPFPLTTDSGYGTQMRCSRRKHESDAAQGNNYEHSLRTRRLQRVSNRGHTSQEHQYRKQSLADARKPRHATRRADNDAQQPPIGHRRGPASNAAAYNARPVYPGRHRNSTVRIYLHRVNVQSEPSFHDPRTLARRRSTYEAIIEHNDTQKIPSHRLPLSTAVKSLASFR